MNPFHPSAANLETAKSHSKTAFSREGHSLPGEGGPLYEITQNENGTCIPMSEKRSPTGRIH